MSYSNHGHSHMFGLAAIVYVIAYVFGKSVARYVVGSALVVGLVCFAYVMYRIVGETI